MIQANELRIGNWVRVVGVYKDSISKAGIVLCDPELIKLADDNKILLIGISITPEILQKTGFKEYSSAVGEMQLEYKNDHWICKRHNGFVYLSYDFEICLTVELAHIEHLHHLQNLYYALTGEELNIQL